MKDYIITELKKKYTVNDIDVGEFANIKHKLTKAQIKDYEVVSVGKVSTMYLSSFFNSAKLEMVVFVPEFKDAPMMVYKHMEVLGQSTLIIRLLDMQAGIKLPLYEFNLLNEQYSDIPDYDIGPRFSDSMLLEQSVCKRSTKKKDVFYKYSREYINTFIRLLSNVPDCSRDYKMLRAKSYVEGLLVNSDSYLNEMRSCIGLEKANYLFEKYIFNCKE